MYAGKKQLATNVQEEALPCKTTFDGIFRHDD
jgi:hypothetical protein